MKPWNQRPREIRALFNPAFCGLVLAHGIGGFEETAKRPMPFSLTLLVLPLCLHKRTRDQIKKAHRAYFTKILSEHPEICVDLAKRTRGLMPYTMEAFAYLMACDAVFVTDDGSIGQRENSIKKVFSGSEETKDCLSVARSLGRKLALINDRATIYTTLGVRP